MQLIFLPPSSSFDRRHDDAYFTTTYQASYCFCFYLFIVFFFHVVDTRTIRCAFCPIEGREEEAANSGLFVREPSATLTLSNLRFSVSPSFVLSLFRSFFHARLPVRVGAASSLIYASAIFVSSFGSSSSVILL